MVAIDVNIGAKSLGIHYEDYSKAVDALNGLIWDLGEDYTADQYLGAIKSLPSKQLVAIVRWNHLDRRFPNEFDWNGIKKGRAV